MLTAARTLFPLCTLYAAQFPEEWRPFLLLFVSHRPLKGLGPTCGRKAHSGIQPEILRPGSYHSLGDPGSLAPFGELSIGTTDSLR